MGSIIPHCIGNLMGMSLNKSLGESNREFDPTDSYAKPKWHDGEDGKEVFQGRELEYTHNLQLLVKMDLSKNKLEGLSLDEIISLTFGLNLSHNHLRGEIPRNIRNMKLLESIDVYCNKLSRKIPDIMSLLTLLSHLNLSHNNFSRQIPTGYQFLTLGEPYNYIGNPLLCGSSIPRKRASDDSDEVS